MPWFGGRAGGVQPDYEFDAEYMGGHKAYPKKRDVKVLIYEDRLVIEKGLDLEIPFGSISNIENSDAQRITKTRVLLTGVIVGLLWKKKFLYTVIDYNDGIVDQTIILDLHRAVEKVQGIIYERMLRSKRIGLSKPDIKLPHEGLDTATKGKSEHVSERRGSPF